MKILTILMYHQLRESFEKDLSWLLANFQIIKPGEPLCSRSMLLTFDDAYKDVYTRLYPALKKHNISAVVAIPTAFIGSSDRYATWEELREMTASGHLIPASHTVTHPDLTTHPDPESELLISKQTIEEKTGVTPKLFVYPYGKWNPPTQPRKDGSPDVWIEGNIIYVGDIYYELYRNDRILYKTIKALELLLPHYTHFIRTNVNTFCNLENVHKFMSSHHASFYSAFFWQGEWYTLGYGILFTKTTAHHIVTEYERLKDHPFLYPDRYPDDCLLTALATGIWPLSPENPFKRYEGLPYNGKQFISEESLKSRALTPHGVFLDKIPSLEEALALCEAAPNTAALYRIKDGLTLDELKILYNYLLETIYGVSLTTENGGG